MLQFPEYTLRFKALLLRNYRAMAIVVTVLDLVINLFSMALLLWCLISWFPNINRYDQPWRTLDMIVSPVISPIQKVVPPIGNIDISAMVLFVAIGFTRNLLHTLL
jgi:YggT family protein